jgi:hypothetical protein
MTTTEVATLKRTELQAAACRAFGKQAAAWTGRATNEELREALISGEVPAKFGNGHSGDLAVAIATAVEGLIAPRLDRDEIAAIAEERFRALAATLEVKGTQQIEVKLPTTTNVVKGRQHELFPTLVRLLGLRLNVYLKGPAGSGKTTAAEKAAEGLGLSFYCQSMGPQTSQANLLGYMDANGHYVPGLLYEPFNSGGVVCLDEIDNSNPGVLTVLNSALSNGYCSFPCGMVRRHTDCVFVACANTFGKGADALYVGRQQLDAATLNRFAVLDWGYDEAFERDLVGTDQKGWVDYVIAIRKVVATLKLRVVVSPRQSLMGAAMLRGGFKREEVEQLVLWASVATDDVAKIKANLKAASAA